MFKNIKRFFIIFFFVLAVTNATCCADDFSTITPTLNNISSKIKTYLNNTKADFKLYQRQATEKDVIIFVNGLKYYVTPQTTTETEYLNLLSKFLPYSVVPVSSYDAIYSVANINGQTNYYGYNRDKFANSASSFSLGTVIKNDFEYNYMTPLETLATQYYSYNILTDKLSTQKQLSLKASTTKKDSTIEVPLSNRTLMYEYVFSNPSGYKEATSRIVNSSKNIEKTVFKNIASTDRGGAVYNSNEISITSDFVGNSTENNIGGAIYNAGVLKTNGVFIKNNTSGAITSGGAVYNTKDLSLTSDFVKNSSSGSVANGGAIANISSDSDAIITTIIGNFIGNYTSASNNSSGGAIYNKGDAFSSEIKSISSIFLSNSSISANSNAYGGAISNESMFSSIDFIVADFITNSSSGKINSYGGAIYNTATIDSIIGDYIENKSISTTGVASGGAITNEGDINSLYGNFIGNNAASISALGGAIYSNNYISFLSTYFVSNSTSSTDELSAGGAIYNSGTMSANEVFMFSGNYTKSETGESKGGAIYNIGTIEGVIKGEFTKNSSSSVRGNSSGGTIYNAGSINSIEANINSSTSSGFSALGGAILTTSEILEIKSDFNNNTVTGLNQAQGGAIYNTGNIYNINSILKQNSATSDNLAEGGAIYNVGNIYSFFSTEEKNSSFLENRSISKLKNANGGAIYNKGSIFDIKQVDFIKNYSRTENGYAQGGAIYNENYITEIDGATFWDNYALTIKKEVLSGASFGGAIYNSGTIDNLTSIFKNNSAKGESAYGGAIYNTGLIVELQSSFEGNYTSSSTGNSYGGAIYLNGDIATGFTNSSFVNNYAYSSSGTASGGAIYMNCDLTITADRGTSSFKGNYVQTGLNNKVSQAIYVGNPAATLYLKSLQRGSIVFEDSIEGVSGYNIDLSGDNANSVVSFVGKIYNATVTLNDINLKIGANTFENSNSKLIAQTGNISFNDNVIKNYTIDNLVSSKEVKYSLDIDPLAQTIDTITLKSNAEGIINIDKLQYIHPLTENLVLKVLYTNSTKVKLTLTNQVDDIASTVSNTVYNTDKFVQKAGASIVNNDSLKLMYASNLDALKLINEKVVSEREEREFIFKEGSNNKYVVQSDLSSIGKTTKGRLSIIGFDNGSKSLLDFSNVVGFDIEDNTTLAINNVNLYNSPALLTVNNSHAVVFINDSVFTDNGVAINNISGEVKLTNSIIDSSIISSKTNEVQNSAILTLSNSELRSKVYNWGQLETTENTVNRIDYIENNGVVELNGEDTLNIVQNNGVVKAHKNTFFVGEVTNSSTMNLYDQTVFEATIFNTEEGIINTVSTSDNEGIEFNTIENSGKFVVNASVNKFKGEVNNIGEITINSNSDLEATVKNSGTTKIVGVLNILEKGEFSEEQVLNVEKNAIVNVKGGKLYVNMGTNILDTSTETDEEVILQAVSYDVLNGSIVGESGEIVVSDSRINHEQISILPESDTILNLTNVEYDLTNDGINTTCLGLLLTDENTNFKLDVDFNNKTYDNLIVHEASTATINILELNGLTQDNFPWNELVELRILNENTSAKLALNEDPNSPINMFNKVANLEDYYNPINNKYQLTSEDFIGKIGIFLDASQKTILIGNVENNDLLNYLNTRNNVVRELKILPTGYSATANVGVTGSGTINLYSDFNSGENYVVDLKHQFSGFELVNRANISLNGIAIQNAVATDESGCGSVILAKSQNSQSTVNITNVTFKENSATKSGGAIYNTDVISEIRNSLFYDNYVLNEASDETLYGGAIYTNKGLKIVAFDGVSIFKGNYTQSNTSDINYEAIYLADSNETLVLQANYKGVIQFFDSINGVKGYKLSITGDQTGKVCLYNKVYNANAELNNTNLFIAEDTFSNPSTNLTATQGVISMQDDKYADYKINSLSSSDKVLYFIDFDLVVNENDELEYKTDTITVLDSSSTGNIRLSDGIFTKLNLKDKDSALSKYLFDHSDTLYTIKVLNKPENCDLVLTVIDSITDYGLEKYNYEVKSSDFFGEIGFKGNGVDSFLIGVHSRRDAFVETNIFNDSSLRRTFTLESDYILTEQSFGNTGAGEFEIFADGFSIDFNESNGFNLENPQNTAVIINDASITNAKVAVSTNSVGEDVSVKLNNTSFYENIVAIQNNNAVYFSGVIVEGASNGKANEIINNGRIFFNGENRISSSIYGIGTLNLISGGVDLTEALVSNNQFNLDYGSLKIGENTFRNATIVANGGLLDVADGETTNYYINKLIANRLYLDIDVDVTNRVSDRFDVGSGSTGTIYINSFNKFVMPEFVENCEIPLLFRQDPNDTIIIELSEELKNSTLGDFTIDRYFDGEKFIANENDYLGSIKLSTNNTKDAIIIKATKTGSILSIFNKHNFKERVVNFVSNSYVENYNLGITASGTMTVIGDNKSIDFYDGRSYHSGFVLSNNNTVLKIKGVDLKNASSDTNGSVISATAYKNNLVNLVDVSLINNFSRGLGGAIYTASNLNLIAEDSDVILSGNLSNNGSVKNDIYLDNSKNINLVLNLVAKKDHAIDIVDGIDFNKTGLIINVNEKLSTGTLHVVGNLGTSLNKQINVLNINGGILSLIDNKLSDIYVKSLNVLNDTEFQIDIDVSSLSSDKFVIPSKSAIPDAKLRISPENINMLSYLSVIGESADIRLINTTELTSKYFGFVGTESDTVTYTYDGVLYYFILGTEGYLTISRDIPDYYLHPLVCAIKNPVSNTYTMSSDNTLYNYGSFVKNPTQNNIQSKKFTINGNNYAIIAEYLDEASPKLKGIALTGTTSIPAVKQQFIVKNTTFKQFDEAIINKGGKVTLNNVSFENNISEKGSAILNESGTLTLSGTSKVRPHLYNNNSNNSGGAIYNSGTLTLKYTDLGKLPTEEDGFANTSALGGAIYNIGTITSSYNNYTNNIATLYGGAIDNHGVLKTNYDVYSLNSAEKGGAIYSTKTFTDKNSVFDSNTASQGGAIYYERINATDALSLTKSVFKNNSATIDGGGLYNVGKASITSANFIGNYATGKGGAIYNKDNCTISKSTFGSGKLEEANNSFEGGAIYNNSTLTTSSTTFDFNTATYGGAIYNYNPVYQTDYNLKLNSKTVLMNNRAFFGGGLYNNGNAVVQSATFNNNTAIVDKSDSATGCGGGIYNKDGSNIDIKSTTFISNNANKGGAIYNEGVFTVNSSTFGNTSKKYDNSNYAYSGGVMFNVGGGTISNSTLSYNSAELFGGAIYNDITDEKYSLVLTKNKITYNKTVNENGFGGAIYNKTGVVNLQGNTVSSNTACTGGAIYNQGTLNVSKAGSTKSTFTDNKGTFGGAIYNKGNVNLDNATFTNNTAQQAGGAVFLSILPTEDKHTATISNTTFSSNTSSDAGGAIYALGNYANDVYNYITISNCTFTSNKANTYGGAIYADTNSVITIIDSSFKNNSANVRGGAIFINGGAEVSIIAQTKNVTFSGNKANGTLNGIYLNSHADDEGNYLTAVLNLQSVNKKTITFSDYIEGIGTINIYGDTKFDSNSVIKKGSEITLNHLNSALIVVNENSLSGVSLVENGTGSLIVANGSTRCLSLASLTLVDDTVTNSKIDMNLQSKTSDKIQAETVEGAGVLNVSGVNVVTNSKTPVEIKVGEDSIVSSMTATKAESAEATYKLKSYYDENGLLRAVVYGQKAKPSAVASPVATQLGGYLTQINSYDQAFMNMDLNMVCPRDERELSGKWKVENGKCCHPEQSEGSRDSSVMPQNDGISYNAKGLWNRPYATFERVNLNNGPKVSNVGYGNFFGGDADVKQLRNGWKRQFSAYVGYNGSVQDYDRQSIDQNGGTVGITEVWYKNNFFSGLTVNAGANIAQAHTDLGRENIPMFMTGIASKTGYNFEFNRGKFIVQPSFLMSYSFIHTFEHENGKGSHVGSSPLNAIQVVPSIKFIANLKNGWQPYFNVNMRWNIIDKTHFSLRDVGIPEMSIDPYVEYGIGLQRRWGERFTGYGQAMIRNGGRNGVMLSFGFKWLL